MLRKSRTIALRASSTMAPASSTPVGPPPTMTKVSSLRRSAGSSADLGLLEGRQDAGADFGGVADRLQAGRGLLPFVVAEIGVARAGRDHQDSRRECGGSSVITMRAVGVDVLDLFHQHGRVLLAPQDAADRHGDLRRRQAGGRHLVEQRLEQMVVAAVDDRHVDRRLAQPDAPR